MTDTQQPTRTELIEEALRLRIRLAKMVTQYGEKYPKLYTLEDIIAAAVDVHNARRRVLEGDMVIHATRT